MEEYVSQEGASVNPDNKFVLSDEIILQELSIREKGYWCFNTETGDSFKLNETSYEFLMCFQQPCSFRSALEKISARCENLPSSAASELTKLFMKSIEKSILLTKSGGTP